MILRHAAIVLRPLGLAAFCGPLAVDYILNIQRPPLQKVNCSLSKRYIFNSYKSLYLKDFRLFSLKTSGGFQRKPLTGGRMAKRKVAGMQQQTRRKRSYCSVRIQPIAHHGVTDGRHMDPQLVGAAGYGLQFDPGGVCGCVIGQAAPVRDAGLSQYGVDDAQRPTVPVGGNGQVNGVPFQVRRNPAIVA